MKTKVYSYHFDAKLACQKLLLICVVGFMWQSCSESEINSPANEISEKISICKTTGTDVLKDSTGQNNGITTNAITSTKGKNRVKK